MDVKLVRKLGEIMNAEGLKTVEINEGDLRIRIERDDAPPIVRATIDVVAPIGDEVLVPAKKRGRKPKEVAEDVAPEPVVEEVVITQVSAPPVKIFEIRSPLEGIFYANGVEGPDPLVTVGQRVKKGDALCVIESGKDLSEITSEIAGEIVEVMMLQGDRVEVDQMMFKIKT